MHFYVYTYRTQGCGKFLTIVTQCCFDALCQVTEVTSEERSVLVCRQKKEKTPLKAIIREVSRDPFLFVVINDSKVSNNNNNNNNNKNNSNNNDNKRGFFTIWA